MTCGILESINNKNKIYKKMHTNRQNTIKLFNTLKNAYHIYRARLRIITEGKRIFYATTFLCAKNDLQKTFGVISDTLESSDQSKFQVLIKVGNYSTRDTDEIAKPC